MQDTILIKMLVMLGSRHLLLVIITTYLVGVNSSAQVEMPIVLNNWQSNFECPISFNPNKMVWKG